ncbi:metabolite traffic protein EboE [Lentisphaera profundi]|uniref:Metabolite traffic protein EboE n=1 Tax=Lentisphaera profundi TaxID=1658616 RepID=A0ABY7VTU7_9BACT|nr:metabolite traffic protein EboE [Lentisphaera profundi]WDE97472.1 metabolite traffic protein EboE [Lentisphaera profundi]
MQVKPGRHLSFCLNVFALDTLEKILIVLANECRDIKKSFSSQQDMGLGLWLSAQVVEELQAEDKLSTLKSTLKNFGFYVFTLNIFPYGNFHQSPVKENVYYPDWGEQKRLDYTCKAADVLSELCPDNYGTMSTVPVGYGKVLPSHAIHNIAHCATYLNDLHERTGVKIDLAFEPEPDCYLETCDEAIIFFELLKQKLPNKQLSFLGICLDTCHSSLQFELPYENIKKYLSAKINIAKVQVSAAVILDCKSDLDKQVLLPFSEPVYLHQTRILKQNGEVEHYQDLPQALVDGSHGEWRCHFHIPLYFNGEGSLSSSNKDLTREFFELAQKHCKHFETETYTYFVLPEPKEKLSASISKELMWTKDKF